MSKRWGENDIDVGDLLETLWVSGPSTVKSLATVLKLHFHTVRRLARSAERRGWAVLDGAEWALTREGFLFLERRVKSWATTTTFRS